MPNTQPTERSIQTAQYVEVHSVFPTIQGEGPFAGEHAIFIRLAGCNLQCPFCDTEYTLNRYRIIFDTSTAPPDRIPGDVEIDAFINTLISHRPIRPQVVAFKRQLIVVTGGEPYRQNLEWFVQYLTGHGFKVQIETNGTLFQPIDKVTVVCSPKTPKIHPDLAQEASAFKYVLDADHVDPKDGLPAGTMGGHNRTARPPEGWQGEVYVQPLDEGDPAKNKLNLQACVDSVMRYGYRLCIQTHKIANVP